MPIIVFFVVVTTLASLHADTLIMKDKNEIKGLVVEEYIDRIVLSTTGGEKTFFKKDIDAIQYDTPEQNFMQLGKEYDKKELYEKAAFYYKKALDLNPDYKKARDAYLAMQTKIWRKEDKMTKKEFNRRNMIKDWRENRYKTAFSPAKDKKLILEEGLGILLAQEGAIFIIEKVVPFSSADKAGIKKGDILISIWGEHISHRKIDEIIDDLIGPKYSEVRISLERDVPVLIEDIRPDKDLYKGLGVLLDFEYEGLKIQKVAPEKIGKKAGFKKSDFVMAIDGESTRYSPLDKIIGYINNAKNKEKIIFTIRRTLILRRGGK